MSSPARLRSYWELRYRQVITLLDDGKLSVDERILRLVSESILRSEHPELLATKIISEAEMLK